VRPAERRQGLGFDLSQALLLAGLTWKEGVRRRVLLLGLLLTTAFVLLYALGTYYSFREGGPLGGSDMRHGFPSELSPEGIRQAAAFQMLVFGIFISSFLGAMVVCFSAAGAVTGDAENGTLQTILTRPISRLQVLAGRFAGYATVYLAYLVLLGGSLLLVSIVLAEYSPRAPWQALALLGGQGLILLAVVTLVSVRFSPLAAGVAGFMLFGLAFIGGVVEQIGRLLQNATATDLGRGMSYLMPTDSFFRMALSGLSPRTPNPFITLQQLGPLSGVEVDAGRVAYGLLYAAAIFAVAALLLQRRDF
jgi:Cu-processing system permease protein